MADLSVSPVATQIKPVPSMSLGDMINVARGAQQYQQAAQINPLELQQKQQTTRTGEIVLSVEEQRDRERLAMQRVMSDPSLYSTNGKYDPAKATAIATQVAPLTGLAYLKDMAGSFGAQEAFKTAATGAESSAMDFANKQVNAIAGRLTSLINNPLIIAAEQNPQAVNANQLAEIIKKYGEDQASALGMSKDKASQLMQPYLDQTKNPAGIRQFLKDKLLSTLDQGSRITAMQPTGVAVSTGAGGATVQTGQFGPYAPGQALPGTTFETQIPPTAEVVSATGAKQMIGPMSQRGTTPLTTNLGPAQTALLTAGGETIGSDLQITLKEGAEAPGRVAIFQNIKKFTPDAFTGVGGQRKELAAGILNAIGIPAYEAEKVSTEQLAKNSALLTLAGGNTDAARALAEVATPNKKLDEKAILAIANQMIGIENMKIAKSNYLGPVQNDAIQYGQRKLQFDQIADPRIFQEMTAQDVAKLKASMSPAEQAELTRKIRLARQMGIIR
jgi:hypothetical protein